MSFPFTLNLRRQAFYRTKMESYKIVFITKPVFQCLQNKRVRFCVKWEAFDTIFCRTYHMLLKDCKLHNLFLWLLINNCSKSLYKSGPLLFPTIEYPKRNEFVATKCRFYNARRKFILDFIRAILSLATFVRRIS